MKKSIKGIVCASLAATMMLSICGCGTEPATDDNVEAVTTEENSEGVTESAEERTETIEEKTTEAMDIATGDATTSDAKSTAETDSGIETDIPDLRSAVASEKGLGPDAICGTCVGTGVNDKKLMDLVEKHFNAVTLENELKPDAVFGYNNDSISQSSLQEVELNGETMMVPKLDFSRADNILDSIYWASFVS